MSAGQEMELRYVKEYIEKQIRSKNKDILTLKGHIDGLNAALNKVQGILKQTEISRVAQEFEDAVRGSGKSRLDN